MEADRHDEAKSLFVILRARLKSDMRSRTEFDSGKLRSVMKNDI